jgi:hypothetical protein
VVIEGGVEFSSSRFFHLEQREYFSIGNCYNNTDFRSAIRSFELATDRFTCYSIELRMVHFSIKYYGGDSSGSYSWVKNLLIAAIKTVSG